MRLAADLQVLLGEHRNFLAHHAAEHDGRIMAAGDGRRLRQHLVYEFSGRRIASGAAYSAVPVCDGCYQRYIYSRLQT